MDTGRRPARARAAIVVVVVLLLVAIGSATAAVRWGASALGVGGGFIVSSRWSPAPRWAGIEIENRTGTPITLRGVTVRGAVGVAVLDVRVTGPRGTHLLSSGEPLPTDAQRAIDGSVPIDGFVLPPHSRDQYQVVIRFRPIAAGRAVLSRVAVVYSVWGLDHGAISSGVYCLRAPGTAPCPSS